MSGLILHETALSQWQALVVEAESQAAIHLPHELEAYLVLLLSRFCQADQLGDTVIALSFLEAQQASGHLRLSLLHDVGDKCLLFAGLYPQLAARRRVNLQYFIQLGQGAYRILGEPKKTSMGLLFAELSKAFIPLMDVLLYCRAFNQLNLTPIEAWDLWSETQSQYAKALVMNWTERSKG
jgi:hypothetical protein